MSVLSQVDLRTEVEKDAVRFDPGLMDDQWGEVSVDLRLGKQFTMFKTGFEDVTVSVAKGLRSLGGLNIWNTKTLKDIDELEQAETLKLKPGMFVLALTNESITVPRHLIALIEGRSTYARVGMSMHQTAPWIQPGWSGPIVLEIMNHGPLTIELTPMVDRPCQLTFFELKTELPEKLAYGTRPTDLYQGQKHPLVHERK
jgi:dCTP deaminase